MIYKIVNGMDVSEFQDQVNRLLKEGFELCGSLHVCPTHFGTDPNSEQAKMVGIMYSQAMIKKE